MNLYGLPEPPTKSSANCLAFYTELRIMLHHVRPGKLSTSKNSVKFGTRSLQVWLGHTEMLDWAIGVTMDESAGIVLVGPAHEHFFLDEQTIYDRSWTTQMVDFLAEALRGEIETRTDFRGASPVAVEHFRVEADESAQSLGYTSYFTPARAMLWRPKTSVTDRVSFM